MTLITHRKDDDSQNKQIGQLSIVSDPPNLRLIEPDKFCDWLEHSS